MFAAFAACIACALGFFEPRYGGVPASVYLRDVISQDRFGGPQDKEKILVVPPRVGVPILIRFTQAQDPRWRGWYQRFYPRLPQFITRRLGPPKSNVAIVLKAIRALGYYGSDAHPAVPHLLKLDPNAQAFPCSSVVQHAVVNALGEIGPGASNAIPMLITRLQCSDEGTKWQALAVVQRIGPAAAPALNQIIPLLSDKNERIRGKAAEAVAAIGPDTAWAKPALEALRDDKWGFVRDAVEAALKNSASESPPPVTASP